MMCSYLHRAAHREKYPELTPTQTEKLRQLSIVTLAQKHEVSLESLF